MNKWVKKKHHIYRITNVNSNRPYNLQCHDELTTNYYKVSKKGIETWKGYWADEKKR